MAMEGIHNVPDFRYNPKVEHALGQKRRRNRDEEEDPNQKKKKKKQQAGALFESLADSLGQYSDEPFQFNG